MQLWMKGMKPVQLRALGAVCLPGDYWVRKQHNKLLVGVKEFYFYSSRNENVCVMSQAEFQRLESNGRRWLGGSAGV